MQAAAALKATWTDGAGLPPQREFYDYLRKQPSRDTFVVDSQDVDETLAKAADRRQGDLPPSVPDARLDGHVVSPSPTCRAARRRSGRRRSPSYPTRSGVAMLLGLPADNVRVVFTRGSGCYGINGADTVSYDAALLSQARRQAGARAALAQGRDGVGELRHARTSIDQRVGLDADGTIIAWDYEAWFASLGGRPGYETPGQRRHRHAGRLPDRAVQRRAQAAEPPAQFNNGSNAAPSYVVGLRRRATPAARGRSRSERVLTHTVRSPFFTGPLRSPARLQNTFAHECFLDEVAAHVKADPVAYRLRHLSDPRLKEVVAAAAKAANWEARPVAAARSGEDRHRERPRLQLRALRGRQRLHRDGGRGRRRSGDRQGHRQASGGGAGLRPDLESRRHAQPDRGRRAAGLEPRARRRGHLGRSKGHVGRLADVPQPAARLRRADRSRAC